MNYIFAECYSLSYIPNISKWNISSVKDISYMFYDCKSLSILPDISIWETKRYICKNNILEGCISLSSLPDVSKCVTKNNTIDYDDNYNIKGLINCLNNRFEQI